MATLLKFKNFKFKKECFKQSSFIYFCYSFSIKMKVLILGLVIKVAIFVSRTKEFEPLGKSTLFSYNK